MLLAFKVVSDSVRKNSVTDRSGGAKNVDSASLQFWFNAPPNLIWQASNLVSQNIFLNNILGRINNILGRATLTK